MVRQLIEIQTQNLLQQVMDGLGETHPIGIDELKQRNPVLAQQLKVKAETEVRALIAANSGPSGPSPAPSGFGQNTPRQPPGPPPGPPPPLAPAQPQPPQISIPLAEVVLPEGLVCVGGSRLLTGATGGPVTLADANGQALPPEKMPACRPGPFECLAGVMTSGEVNLDKAHSLVQVLQTKAATAHQGFRAAALAVAGELESMIRDLNTQQQERNQMASQSPASLQPLPTPQHPKVMQTGSGMAPMSMGGPGPMGQMHMANSQPAGFSNSPIGGTQFFHNPPLDLGIGGGSGVLKPVEPGADFMHIDESPRPGKYMKHLDDGLRRPKHSAHEDRLDPMEFENGPLVFVPDSEQALIRRSEEGPLDSSAPGKHDIPRMGFIQQGGSLIQVSENESPQAWMKQVLQLPFTAEALRELNPRVIDALYKDLKFQCKQDGCRFRTKEQLDKHMDLLFQRNNEKKKAEKGGSSRKWYMTIDDWKVELFGNKKKGVDGNTIFLPDDPEIQALLEKQLSTSQESIPADENCKECKICGELFETDYDDDQSEWVYRGARQIRLIGEAESDQPSPIIVHKLCLEASGKGPMDLITVDEWKNIEGVQSPAGLTSPTSPTSPVCFRKSLSQDWPAEQDDRDQKDLVQDDHDQKDLVPMETQVDALDIECIKKEEIMETCMEIADKEVENPDDNVDKIAGKNEEEC